MSPFKAVAVAALRAPISLVLVTRDGLGTPELAQKLQARAPLARSVLLALTSGLLFSLSLNAPAAHAFTDAAVLASCRPVEATDMLPGEACLCSAEGLDSTPTPQWYLGHLGRLHAAGAMSAAELRAAVNEMASVCASSPGTVKRAIAEVVLRPALPTGITLTDRRRSASKSR